MYSNSPDGTGAFLLVLIIIVLLLVGAVHLLDSIIPLHY